MNILQVEGLTVRFGGLVAVNDLSFSVRTGEVFAMMGPNGAGKTTAFDAIGGFVQAAAGAVRFEGKPILGLAPERIAALGIRRTFQNNGILREMTVLENVLTGLELSTPSSLLGVVTGWPAAARAERSAVVRAREMLEQMEIGDLEERAAGDLSFGQQRARLIMLDEPAVGLSPNERLHLGQVLRRLAGTGITVLLVEHVQDLVMAVSDQVLVLNFGRKLVQCPPEEVRQNEEVLEAYLGNG